MKVDNKMCYQWKHRSLFKVIYIVTLEVQSHHE